MNSYKLLQQKMTEIEKSKRKKSSPDSENSSTKKTTSETRSDRNFEKDRNLTKASSTRRSEAEKDDVVIVTSTKPQDPNIPDHTYGDYYCRVCDSHMNSDGMWEAHITGKRHLKNLKKTTPETKYDDLDEESSILYEIRNVKDAVVGLSYIQEIRRKEPGAPPLFTCFICQATLANAAMLIEHVISMKHRLNYIKERTPSDYSLLTATKLKKGNLEPLVTELAIKLEDKFGRGTVKVKKEKEKMKIQPYNKQQLYSSDEDDIARPPKRQKCVQSHVSKDYYSDNLKEVNFKEIRDCREIIEEKRRHMYTSDEDIDMDYRTDLSKKPVYRRHLKRSESPPPRSKMTYSCSPPQELKKVSHVPTYFPRSPADDLLHSRSNQLQETEPVNSSQVPNAVISAFAALKKADDLPLQLVLKLLISKMKKFEGKDPEDWATITKDTEEYMALYNRKKPVEKFSSDFKEFLAEMFRQNKIESNLQDNRIIKESKNEQNTIQPYTIISNMIRQAKNYPSPPVYNNETHQTTVPEVINTENNALKNFGFNSDYENQANKYSSSSEYGSKEMIYPTSHQQNPYYANSTRGNTEYTGNTHDNMPTTSDSYSYYTASSNVVSHIPGLNYTEEPGQASYQHPYYDSSPLPKYT